MSKKKKNDDGVYFLGQSSIDVTGSQYLVKFGGYQILLECGLYQASSNDVLDSYRINAAKFKFKPKEIDYVFICHGHIDHTGLTPRLVKEGFRGQIITTQDTATIMGALLMNSAYIVNSEAEILSKRFHREYTPLYSEDDVHATMSLVHTYDDYNTIIKLNDTISFQWMKNAHCVGSAQLQLILRDEIKTKKILYTSDLGALSTDNHYVENTEIPTMFSDISIIESTYGDNERSTSKTRAYDLEHFKVAVITALERGGSVILPCFSFSRTQEILTNLYLLFGGDENFKTQVVVDSMLSCAISELYGNILEDDNLELWNKVSTWDNVRFIYDKADSKNCLGDNTPKIVISSSGFCTNGRVINYLQKYLKDDNSIIIFSGYVGDNPSYLSYRIKNYSNHSKIKVHGKQIPNKADCITLSTFSSHASHNDLVKFGSSLNTNKLVLVHGSPEAKKCLSSKLKEAISKNNKAFKVVCANKGMAIRL